MLRAHEFYSLLFPHFTRTRARAFSSASVARCIFDAVGAAIRILTLFQQALSCQTLLKKKLVIKDTSSYKETVKYRAAKTMPRNAVKRQSVHRNINARYMRTVIITSHITLRSLKIVL